MSADSGSLKPMWPVSPIPSSCRSMPPAAAMARLVRARLGRQVGGDAVGQPRALGRQADRSNSRSRM
jgi:hypothetical protein